MAQLVGDAYIRIFGDTSAMRNAIHKEQRLLESEGAEAADSYLLHFNKTIEERAKVRMRGSQVAIADAIVNEDFRSLLKKSGREIDAFVTDMKATFEEWNSHNYFGTGTTGAHNFRKALDALNISAERMTVAKKMQDMAEAAKASDKAMRDQERAWVTYGKNLLATQKLLDGNKTLLHRYGNDIDMVTVRVNRHADSLGRAFGAGSRSEILNFVGRTIGNLSRIPGVFLKMGASVVSFLDDVRVMQSEGGSLLGSFAKVAMRSFGGIAASAASLVIGIGAMSQILPAVIYLLGLLLGSVVAVAGAIGQGLIGALLPLGPLILGAGVGIAALTMGISGLEDASKSAKAAVKPLGDAWAKFRKDFTEGFVKDIKPAISGFVTAIEDTLVPLFDNLSNVLGWLAKRFTAVFNSKEMKPFLDAFETSLPHIFQSLGSALIEFGAGLTAFFKPILPFAEKLAQKIEDAAAAFSDWASSAAGQNSIREFMEKAWIAASNLWTVIKNIGSIIWSVFGAGAEGPGKDFLTWLAEVTTKWAEFLKTPEGQQALKTFFEDVRDFMLQVKDLAITIKEKMDQIDWEQVKQDVDTFMTAVQGALQIIGYIFEQVSGAVNTVRDALANTGWDEFFAEMDEFGTGINERLNTLRDNVIGWAESFGTWINNGLTVARDAIVGWMETIGETVNGALDRLWFGLTDPWIRAWNWLTTNVPTWPGIVAGWMSQFGTLVNGALDRLWFALTDPWVRGWNWLTTNIPTWPGIVAGWIAQIPARIPAALATLFNVATAPFQNIWRWVTGEVPQWPGRIGAFIAGIPGSITRALSGLVNAFTQPFRDAYNAVAGWVQDIRDLVNGAISWIANNAPTLPDWMVPGISGPPRGGAGGGMAASFGRGTSAASAGLRGADNPLGALPSLSSITRALQPVEQRQQQAQRVVHIYPGAIVVQSPSSDPEQVAGAVVDRLAARLVSV